MKKSKMNSYIVQSQVGMLLISNREGEWAHTIWAETQIRSSLKSPQSHHRAQNKAKMFEHFARVHSRLAEGESQRRENNNNNNNNNHFVLVYKRRNARLVLLLLLSQLVFLFCLKNEMNRCPSRTFSLFFFFCFFLSVLLQKQTARDKIVLSLFESMEQLVNFIIRPPR